MTYNPFNFQLEPNSGFNVRPETGDIAQLNQFPDLFAADNFQVNFGQGEILKMLPSKPVFPSFQGSSTIFENGNFHS